MERGKRHRIDGGEPPTVSGQATSAPSEWRPFKKIRTSSLTLLFLALTLGAAAAVVFTFVTPTTAPVSRAEAVIPPTSLDPAPPPLPSVSSDTGIASVAESTVTTENCYQARETQPTAQTLCFQVFNGSGSVWNDEWLTEVRLTFPTLDGDWAVACNPGLQDPTDSVGYPVTFKCTTPKTNEVLYQDNEDESPNYGEISSGSSWGTCVDVTVPSGYLGDRYIHWGLTGDGSGDPPHEISGTLKIEKCTPLTLEPSRVTITGCNGIPQTLEFELTNYEAGDTDVDLIYSAPDADFAGPTSLHINQGEIFTFTTQLEPRLCLDPDDTIVASLTVEAPGSGHADTSVVTQTIAESAGWRRREDSSIPTMDNAVIWANHGDGGLWSVGGYGSGGAAQRYDPPAGEWISYTNPLTPVIEYPMDGCYGLNDVGDEIIVLFPDTIVTGALQIFNITHSDWYTEPVPAPGYPAEGRWGQDIVSMLQHTGDNVCYLSGGSNQVGGGRTKDLWEYLPGANTASYVGPFTDTVPPYEETPVFNFHASWYVPWVGDEGAICVAGGVDHNHQINDSTQCYDLKTEQFNERDADLGTLPEPWWGMADGWQITDEGYELWIANGVARDGTLLPVSAFIREDEIDFEYGPEIPHGLYRLEGDAWDNEFYTLNGSRGGFWYSEFSLHLGSCPTCHRIYLPVALQE